jgi:photosystem II stability/assembly factor-like uncharacterized protein
MSLIRFLVRISLFIFILVLGTVATLVVGEVEGLARADLSNAPVRAMTNTADNQVLYATLADDAQPGIYRSDDDGRTWQLTGSGPGVPLNVLAVHPVNQTVLYAGAAGGPVATTNNLWRSDDGGQTWRKFFLSLPGSVDGLIPAVTALTIDRNQPNLLYVGTDGQGVYRFNVDYDGYGYELVGGVSLYDAHVTNLEVGPDDRVYALTTEGVVTSKDDDAWRKLETVPDYPVSLAVAPTDPETLYAGVASSGAYRSTDGGRTWEPIAEGLGLVPGAALRVTALTVDQTDSWHVAAATAYGIGKQLAGGGIYESDDGGRKWTKLGDVDDVVTELNFGDNGTIQAATDSGLVRYGPPSRPAPAIPFGLDTLTQLSGPQIFILTLTTGLVGLALVGQKKWG